MKHLFIFFLFILSASFVLASPLQSPLIRAVAKQTVNSNKNESLAQVSRCLQSRTFCTVIDWPTAAKYYADALQQSQQRQGKIQSYQQQRNKLFPPQSNTRPYTPPNEQAALAKLNDYKFIFIGESHIDGIRPAVIRILKSVRNAHPDKRILLAAEGLIARAPNNIIPLEKFNIPRPQGLVAHIPSIDNVLKAAKNLHMDILALDDKWIEQKYNNQGGLVYPIKVGNFLVDADSYYGEVNQIAARYSGQDVSHNPVLTIYALQQFFLASSWGILQRNTQWKNYIHALQNQYDIIIVYAGKAHLNPFEKIPSVAQLLNWKNYAFVTIDKVPNAQELEVLKKSYPVYNGNISHWFASKAQITYLPTPSIQGLLKQKPQVAQIAAPLIALEKELGFYNDNSLQLEIVLPAN